MSSFDNIPDDLTECMSLPNGSNGDGGALRERVLAQTTGVLRARRRLKRLGYAAALVGCYLAGMATVSIMHPNRPQSVMVATTGSTIVTHGSTGGLPPVHHPIRPEDDGVFPESTVNRSAAAPQKHSPYERLRQAGDRQLDDENDIAAAACTYRRALQVASSDQRSISVDHDSWLMMAMKNDQSQTIAENTP